MARLSVLAAAVGVLLCGAGLASGQIAAAPQAQASPGQGAGADRLTCGDWKIDVGVNALELTAEQKDQLKPKFEEFAKEIKAAQAALAEKLKPTGEKIKAMRDAARKDGTLAALQDQEDYKALLQESNKLQAEETKAAAARHERILAEVLKVLTPAQKRKLQARLGQGSGDPKVILQSWAADAIDHWAPGLEFSDQRYDELVAKLAAMIEKHRANVAEAHETDPLKIQEWWQAFDKRMREVIEEGLTEDQKKQAAAARLARLQKQTATIADMVAKSIDRLDPTPDQKAKLAALVADARERMLKLGPDDQPAWGKVYFQLREDVDKLLTEEQRTKRDTPTVIDMTKPAP